MNNVVEHIMPNRTEKKHKELVGIVKSDKMNKTIVVKVARKKRHSVYSKVITVTKNVKAHDEDNVCKVGDKVRLIESSPYSKDKRWRLLEVLDNFIKA